MWGTTDKSGSRPGLSPSSVIQTSSPGKFGSPWLDIRDTLSGWVTPRSDLRIGVAGVTRIMPVSVCGHLPFVRRRFIGFSESSRRQTVCTFARARPGRNPQRVLVLCEAGLFLDSSVLHVILFVTPEH